MLDEYYLFGQPQTLFTKFIYRLYRPIRRTHINSGSDGKLLAGKSAYPIESYIIPDILLKSNLSYVETTTPHSISRVVERC